LTCRVFHPLIHGPVSVAFEARSSRQLDRLDRSQRQPLTFPSLRRQSLASLTMKRPDGFLNGYLK
jgi:hypothetical protein